MLSPVRWERPAGARSRSGIFAYDRRIDKREEDIMAQSGRLAEHVAIVTAGGQGIGEAIAKTFSREGARVAVVDLNRSEAERVAKEITQAGHEAIALEVDATQTP